MAVIYTPTGKAREYSPYACNLYSGCNHGCKYCYCPAIRRKTRDNYLIPEVRRNIVRDFENDCKKIYNLQSQVLFCFMTDPYNKLEKTERLTRQCLEIALIYHVPIAILTKSITVIDDIKLIKRFGENIIIGMTITFDNEKDSREWEPGAATPEERIKTLQIFHDAGVKTWASFEPVIKPSQSLNMMGKLSEIVDLFKIGKINNYQGLDKTINWNKFLIESCELLRSKNKDFYIKHDLRQFAKGYKLYGNEINMDEFVMSWGN
jgi:DNA repair photolyase